MKPHLTLLIALRIKGALTLPSGLAPVRIHHLPVATCLLLPCNWVKGHLHIYRSNRPPYTVPVQHGREN